MTEKLTFDELVNGTTDRYRPRYLQREGFFTPDADSLYDPKRIDLYHEVLQYVRAGFDPLEACCEARHKIFGTYPDWCEL